MRREPETLRLGAHTLVLRNAEEADAGQLIEYLKNTTAETRFLVREPEEITATAEEECRCISSMYESEHALMLLAFLDGELAGNCSFTGMPQKRYRHRATVGIALCRKFMGLGIGTVMMETLIQAARNQGLEQLELEVIADNAPAIGLYKKLGFEVCGTLPNNMKYKDGTYADALWMRKKL